MHCKGNHFDLLCQTFSRLFLSKVQKNRPTRQDKPKIIGGTIADNHFIYSSWDGYYKDPEQVKVNPRYKMFRDAFQNVVDIHTSGHADRKTIEKVIKTVNPKEVICIHKEADAVL